METNFREQLRDNRPYWKVIISLAISLIGTILFIYVGVRLLGFFMPFVVGWFIAYIASPLVNWLEKRLKIVKKTGISADHHPGACAGDLSDLFCGQQDLAGSGLSHPEYAGYVCGTGKRTGYGREKPGGHFPDAAGRHPERMAGYHGRPGQIRGKSHGILKRTDGDCSRQCSKKGFPPG